MLLKQEDNFDSSRMLLLILIYLNTQINQIAQNDQNDQNEQYTIPRDFCNSKIFQLILASIMSKEQRSNYKEQKSNYKEQMSSCKDQRSNCKEQRSNLSKAFIEDKQKEMINRQFKMPKLNTKFNLNRQRKQKQSELNKQSKNSIFTFQKVNRDSQARINSKRHSIDRSDSQKYNSGMETEKTSKKSEHTSVDKDLALETSHRNLIRPENAYKSPVKSKQSKFGSLNHQEYKVNNVAQKIKRKDQNKVHILSKCKSQTFNIDACNKNYNPVGMRNTIFEQDDYDSKQDALKMMDEQSKHRDLKPKHFAKLAQALKKASDFLKEDSEDQIQDLIFKSKLNQQVKKVKQQLQNTKQAYARQVNRTKELEHQIRDLKQQQSNSYNKEIRRILGLVSEKQSKIQNLLKQNTLLKQKTVGMQAEIVSLHSSLLNIESLANKGIEQCKNSMKQLFYQLDTVKIDKKLMGQRFEQIIQKLEQKSNITNQADSKISILQAKLQKMKEKCEEQTKRYCQVRQQLQAVKCAQEFRKIETNRQFEKRPRIERNQNAKRVGTNPEQEDNYPKPDILSSIRSLDIQLGRIQQQSLALKKYRQLESIYIKTKNLQGQMRQQLYQKDRQIDFLRNQIDPSHLNNRFKQQKPEIYQYLVSKRRKIDDFQNKLSYLVQLIQQKDEKISNFVQSNFNKTMHQNSVQTDKEDQNNAIEKVNLAANKYEDKYQEPFEKVQEKKEESQEISIPVIKLNQEIMELKRQNQKCKKQAHQNKMKFYDERNQKQLLLKKVQCYKKDIEENILAPKKGKKKKNRCHACFLTDYLGNLQKCQSCENYFHTLDQCQQQHVCDGKKEL